jgi:hypothetical protein
MYTVVPASTRVARALLARLPSRISEHDRTRLAHARPLGDERERLDERPPKFLRCLLVTVFSVRVCAYSFL